MTRTLWSILLFVLAAALPAQPVGQDPAPKPLEFPDTRPGAVAAAYLEACAGVELPDVLDKHDRGVAQCYRVIRFGRGCALGCAQVGLWLCCIWKFLGTFLF